MTTNPTDECHRGREQGDRLDGHPPVLGCTRHRVDEQHQPAGDRRRARGVEVPVIQVGSALPEQERRSARTTTPTGTLTKKIQDQLNALVSAPPASTPAAAPLPETAPQIPSARFRSRPSANVVVRIESAAGERSAAPSP